MILIHHVLAALAVAWHYFCGHLAGVLASTIIPTLMAGMVNRPGANDGKIVALLKLAVRFCGWAKHYDEPGSVKLPLSELLGLMWRGVVAVYRVFKPAPAVLLVIVLAFSASMGCATSLSASGATTIQKLHDDETVMSRVEVDVKTQCGPQFASLGATAAAIAEIALAGVSIAGRDYAGAVQAALVALPALSADAKGVACVVSVLKTDYDKYKPAPAPKPSVPPPSLPPTAARRELVAILDVPPVCDPTNDPSTRACREIAIDDNVPPLPLPEAAQ